MTNYKLLSFVFIFSLFLNEAIAKNSSTDTLKIYYKINECILSKGNCSKLEALLIKLNSKKPKEIVIHGYADYLGTDEYNQILTEKRAQYVKNFFTQKGKGNFISICEGKGKLKPVIENSFLGIPLNRRVEIIISYEEIITIVEPPKIIKVDTLKVVEKPKQKEISKMNVGENFVLNNINFLGGRHVLVEESYPELEKLYTALVNFPNVCIEIQGHICCELNNTDGYDTDTKDNKLSINRAKFIYDYLVEKGIDQKRLTFKGFARTRPIIEYEMNEEDRNKNRRVEIVVTKK